MMEVYDSLLHPHGLALSAGEKTRISRVVIPPGAHTTSHQQAKKPKKRVPKQSESSKNNGLHVDLEREQFTNLPHKSGPRGTAFSCQREPKAAGPCPPS